MKLQIHAIFIALTMATMPALAQSGHDHGHAAITQTVSASSRPMVSGEVRKVDKEQGKLTLSHEPIPNLEMPKMTMVFRASDPAMLGQVKIGEKVRFAADRVNGQLTLMAIEPAK